MGFEFEPADCAACGASASQPYIQVDRFGEGHLNYVRCAECGLIYQNPRPTQESLVEFFSSETFVSASEAEREDGQIAGYYNYLRDEPFRLKLAAARLRRLEGMFPGRKPLRILKIACGTGTFIKVARDRGHDALGVDVSDIFVRVAREHYGVPMLHGRFEDVDLEEKTFDAILLFGAINNLVELRAVFDKVRAHLAPGGVFVFNYIDIENVLARFQKERFWLFRPPAIYQFTRKQLPGMLLRFGWRLDEHRADSQYTSLSKLLGFLGWRPLWRLMERFNLHYKVVRVPIPGGYWCTARPLP
jgi:SAM-dependent methyltransferase